MSTWDLLFAVVSRREILGCDFADQPGERRPNKSQGMKLELLRVQSVEFGVRLRMMAQMKKYGTKKMKTMKMNKEARKETKNETKKEILLMTMRQKLLS